ncbi:putative reverse transcriptase domain-containing protein [Tanacetum coccineum]
MSAANKALIAAVAAALPSSPPPSPLTSLSSPLPEIPSPPLCLPSPLLPLPVPSSPLLLPSTNHREDVPEADVPPQKRLCLTAPAPRFEVGERSAAAAARQLGLDVTHATYYSFVDTMDATPGCIMSREVGYGIMGVWDDMVGDMEERAPTTLEDLSQRVTDLATTLARDTHEIEARDNRLRTRKPEPARDLEPQDGPADAGSSSQGVATTLAEYEAHRSSRNGDELLMESVFHISNCTVECQIKFSTCTLLGNALTWWNSHVKTVGHDAAYEMPWKTLKNMMTDKYCSRGEIKNLEIELWNLKVKGTDVLSYNQRFQELALMCLRMFSEESDEVEKYVGRLLDMIQGSVMASKPKTMQDAIKFATEPMDQKICAFADRQTEKQKEA